MPNYVDLNFSNVKADDTETPRLAVWATGFRPFFLGGALLAALSIVAWLAIFMEGMSAGGPISPIDWHAHEMIFGFTPAIIAGFLLTAVPKWTRVPTPTGKMLAALFALWALGRVAMALAEFLPYTAVAIADLLFLPALAIAIAIPIGRAMTPRNLGFIPLLFGLAIANALFHLSYLGVVDGWATRGLDAGLGIIIVIIAIVGGRVIPFFTANATGMRAISRRRYIDFAAIGLSVAWLIVFIVDSTASWTAAIALGAGAANLARMKGWGITRSLSIPLLWVLHAGYAFVGIGLIAFGLSVFDVTGTRSIAIHALTTGAIGILCLGMMARVALGHTGRKLKAHKITAVAFALIVAAAMARVFLPWAWSSAYAESLIISGALWTVAWALFLFVYTPILLQPRADGRPG